MSCQGRRVFQILGELMMQNLAVSLRLGCRRMRIVEQHLAEARKHNHDRLIALHVKLDADIAEAHA